MLRRCEYLLALLAKKKSVFVNSLLFNYYLSLILTLDYQQKMTCEQLDTLERQVSELKLCCEGSVANFAAKCPNYNGFLNQLIAVWGN